MVYQAYIDKICKHLPQVIYELISEHFWTPYYNELREQFKDELGFVTGSVVPVRVVYNSRTDEARLYVGLVLETEWFDWLMFDYYVREAMADGFGPPDLAAIYAIRKTGYIFEDHLTSKKYPRTEQREILITKFAEYLRQIWLHLEFVEEIEFRAYLKLESEKMSRMKVAHVCYRNDPVSPIIYNCTVVMMNAHRRRYD